MILGGALFISTKANAPVPNAAQPASSDQKQSTNPITQSQTVVPTPVPKSNGSIPPVKIDKVVSAGASSDRISASIDQSSLITDSSQPTITGTAANTPSIHVSITRYYPSSMAFNTSLFGKSIPVVKGHWSFTISKETTVYYGQTSTTLPPGTYGVQIINDPSYLGNSRDYMPLTKGLLTIRESPTNPLIQASISVKGQSTTSPLYGNYFTVGGEANNANALRLLVVLVKADYVGSTDYATIKTLSGVPYNPVSKEAIVEPDRWWGVFEGVAGGTYHVFVYDSTSNTLLASGKITVADWPPKK